MTTQYSTTNSTNVERNYEMESSRKRGERIKLKHIQKGGDTVRAGMRASPQD